MKSGPSLQPESVIKEAKPIAIMGIKANFGVFILRLQYVEYPNIICAFLLSHIQRGKPYMAWPANQLPKSTTRVGSKMGTSLLI